MGGLAIGDEIIGINHTHLNNNLDKWCKYYDHKGISLNISRKHQMMTIGMPTLNRTFYQSIRIRVNEDANQKQIKARQLWGCLEDR